MDEAGPWHASCFVDKRRRADKKGERAVAIEQPKGDQRRHPRWGVRGRLTGRVGNIPKVAVVDISLGGAMIEHPSLFQSGAVMVVNLLFPGHEVGLKCRVIRSDPHGYEVLPTGTRDLLHRTGLEFLDISEASQRVINGYIQFLSELQL
jgi:hypothetical protein